MLTKETLSKYERNPTLKVPVDTDTPMKEWLVNYVGEHFAAEKERFEEAMGQEFKWDGSVTVEMVAELMIREFPDFMLAIAEEERAPSRQKPENTSSMTTGTLRALAASASMC